MRVQSSCAAGRVGAPISMIASPPAVVDASLMSSSATLPRLCCVVDAGKPSSRLGCRPLTPFQQRRRIRRRAVRATQKDAENCNTPSGQAPSAGAMIKGERPRASQCVPRSSPFLKAWRTAPVPSGRFLRPSALRTRSARLRILRRCWTNRDVSRSSDRPARLGRIRLRPIA
jgi:hypothetical protein